MNPHSVDKIIDFMKIINESQKEIKIQKSQHQQLVIRKVMKNKSKEISIFIMLGFLLLKMVYRKERKLQKSGDNSRDKKY